MPSAGGTNYIGTVLTMNVEDFITNAHEARKALNNLRREFEVSSSGGNRWKDSITGIAQRMKYLEDSIRIEDSLIKSYQNRIEKLSNDYEKNASSISHLKEGIDNANISINRYTKQLDECQRMIDKMWLEMEEASRPINQLTETIRRQEKELGDLTIRWRNSVLATSEWSSESLELRNKIELLNETLKENKALLASINNLDPFNKNVDTEQSVPIVTGGFTIPKGILANLATDALYSAIYRVGDALKRLISTGIEFESAFTNVRRTVEGTEADFNLLENQILAMGSEVASSITDIANIASLAGQMGIPVEQISEFTRVMIMLGDTTNITAEEAGDSLARLANLLNLTTDDFERMGSAIVDLGNKFPTTESEIASMASRLAGTANMLHISAQDVLGIANAISAVGLEAEMGGNAISKTLREMQLAVENGTERLDIFAQIANMTATEFVKLFRDDATSALVAFIDGLGDTNRIGKSTTQLLSELNITELRQVDTLSRLATNVDTLNESLEVSRNAWDENLALSIEAGKRYQTTESQIQFMKNAWSQTAVTIQKALNPAIRWGVGLLTDLAEALNGNQLSAQNLDRSLDILISNINDYQKAQEDALGATDETTEAMRRQALVATQQALVQSGQNYKKTIKNINDYAKNYENASHELALAQERFNLLAINHGFSSGEELEEAFYNNSSRLKELYQSYAPDEFSSDIIQAQITGMSKAETDRDTALNNIYTEFTTLGYQMSDLADWIEKGDVSLAQLEVMADEAGGEYGKMLKSMVNTFRNTRESSDKAIQDIIKFTDNDVDGLRTYLDAIDWNINRALTSGADLATDEGLARLVQMRQALKLYIEEIDNESHSVDGLADNLSEAVKKVADSQKEFDEQLTQNTEYNLRVGITGDDARRSEMSIYQSQIRELIEDINDYDDIINSTTSDDDRHAEAIYQKGLAQKWLNELTKEYRDNYSDFITIQGDYDEILQSYNNGIREIAEQEAILGETFDETNAYAQLAEETFNAIIALDPSERGEGWEKFLEMLAEKFGKANDEGQEILDTAEKIIEKFTETENIELGLGNVTDPKVLESLKSSIGTNSQSVIREILGLGDLDALVESGAISQEIADQLNQILIDAEENVALYGNKQSKSGDWFTRWFNASQTAETQEFADGLQSMMNQIAEIWDNIGAGILDVINGWYDAQINAIDAESERLRQSLEENLDLIEQNSNIRENTLRKQLQEGAIDEETYYRESAKASYEAEAQKQLAQQKTADMQEKLQKEKEEIERKQFEADKANSIADVIISTAQAIASAYGVNPIYGAVMSAVLSAIGAAQIATIASQKYTPALATGGIVTAPTTALIGEAGKEAVLPLEQNTDWMDELAQRIGSIVTSDRINTAIDRTMNKDGEVVDKTSNMNFTQIINSPKALSRKEIYRDTRRLVRMVDRRANV